MEQDTRHEPLAKEEIKRFNSPVSIHVLSRRKRLTDADGASAKAVIDGLVKTGFFKDDSPKYIKEVSYSQEKIRKGEEEETVIELWEEIKTNGGS